MKITYYVPVKAQEQEQLLATVKRIFPGSTAKITQRATGTSNIDWQNLESLADLLEAKPIYSPFVAFTIDAPESYSRDQQAVITRPGVEIHREIDPQELLNEIKGEK